ncbi:MAG: hypothetical protein WAZ19_01075 [Anaerolineae bacterium]
MITRGRWEPLVPEVWRSVVVSVIPLSMIIVGIDYLLGETSSALTELERAAPIWVWGLALVTSGLTTVVGYAGRWRHVTIVGLHIGGALMVTIGAGIASWGAALGYWMQVEPPEEQ